MLLNLDIKLKVVATRKEGYYCVYSIPNIIRANILNTTYSLRPGMKRSVSRRRHGARALARFC